MQYRLPLDNMAVPPLVNREMPYKLKTGIDIKKVEEINRSNKKMDI
jgi:hypothetical protein